MRISSLALALVVSVGVIGSALAMGVASYSSVSLVFGMDSENPNYVEYKFENVSAGGVHYDVLQCGTNSPGQSLCTAKGVTFSDGRSFADCGMMSTSEAGRTAILMQCEVNVRRPIDIKVVPYAINVGGDEWSGFVGGR